MGKIFYFCPKCKYKGVYLVRGYDPTPEKGHLWNCRYCSFSARTEKAYMPPTGKGE